MLSEIAVETRIYNINLLQRQLYRWEAADQKQKI